MQAENLYKHFLESSGVSTDSRTLSPGEIFFALSGENYDGHKFVDRAIENGAIYTVIDNPTYYVKGKTILVHNVLESLQQIARIHRTRFEIPIIAITGSNGKTTTKELVKSVLSQKFNTLSTEGNLNNHIGVPLTLLRLNSDHQIAVIEMGANHIGEIGLLCEIALPGYGIITNIGKAHLEGFGSFEGVKKAKSELYQFLKLSQGKVFVNSANPLLHELCLKLELNTINYGVNPGNYLTGKLTGANSEKGIGGEFKCNDSGIGFSVKSNLPGNYNFENIMAAVTIGLYFGVDVNLVKSGIENYFPDNNRSQLIETACNRILMDAYNANPDSMEASINNFLALPGQNKTVILGEMNELGSYPTESHLRIIGLLESKGVNEVFLVGNNLIITLTLIVSTILKI